MEKYIERKNAGAKYKAPRLADRVIEVGSFYYLDKEPLDSEIQTVADYQSWGETAWKEPHGTFRAYDRFYRKLDEEINELIEADYILKHNPQSEKAKNHLVEELGDVMWCITALSTNSSININNALRLNIMERLHDQYSSKTSIYKRWTNQAFNISFGEAHINLSDVDKLIENGFKPKKITANHNGEIAECVDNLLGNLYNLQSSINDLNDGVCIFKASSNYINENVSNIYLGIAHTAYERLGLGLSDVVNRNTQKINARINANRIEKSDGERSGDLL